MGAIALLRKALEQYPAVQLSSDARGVSVKPALPNGFEVSLMEDAHETFVFFEGWHEHFSSAEEAVKCFLFGLSPRCRIRVQRRGGYPYRWTLEGYEDEKWVAYGQTGLIFFPFWRRPEVVYLQNAHIDA